MEQQTKLFLPTARQTNLLLIAGFSALGYAFYMRYTALESSTVGLACGAGLDTYLCHARKVLAALFDNSVFGGAALVLAVIHFLRPTLVIFALAVVLACLGIVLYNIVLSALAIGLLLLSFARRVPEPD